MAIKYYTVPEKKMTVAVLTNCQFDAANKIAKLTDNFGSDFFMYDDKYMMPDTFRVETRCHGDDVFDEETGKKIAKVKLMKKYYKCFDAKMALFRKTLDLLNERVDQHFSKKS